MSIIIIVWGATKFFWVFVEEMTLGISNRSNNCDFFLAKTGIHIAVTQFCPWIGIGDLSNIGHWGLDWLAKVWGWWSDTKSYIFT